MTLFIKRLITVFVCSLLTRGPLMAQSTSYLGLKNFGNASGAEFVSGSQKGTVLMKVNLWGAVHYPGIHHVPVNTDLMTLMSYGGGPTDKAILDEVTIKRELGSTRKLIEVDVEELVTGVQRHHIELAPNDIVVIPAKEPIIERDTLALFTIAGIIASIVGTFALIEATNRD